MIGVDIIKKIRQMRINDGLPIREIVRKTGVSRNTIRKYLRDSEAKTSYCREVVHAPVRTGVEELVEQWVVEDSVKKKKERRTAWRIYDILKAQHKFDGSYESVARIVRDVKQKLGQGRKEAFIPLYFSAGEAFQFDWSDVHAYINRELYTLQMAAVILCHSRKFYPRVYYCQKQELMLDAHRRAFEYFGGTCKRGIYDNLTTAVKKILKGKSRSLQDRFARMCCHYLFEPEFCNPAKGNEKGRVENLMGTIKRNFFTPVPSFATLEELNSSLLSFAVSYSRSGQHPDFKDKTRHEVFESEREFLVSLPKHGFDCSRISDAVVSPSCTVAFDMNKYSVPSEHVGKTVTVKGYAEEVSVIWNGSEIARHLRSFLKDHLVFDPVHYLDLLVKKPNAYKDGMPFKGWLPAVFETYRRMLQSRMEHPDRYFAQTLLLLKEWPLKDVTRALARVLELGLVGDSYILAILRRENEPTLVREEIAVGAHLAGYKALQKSSQFYDMVLRKGGRS